jgi:hypothetical protein
MLPFLLKRWTKGGVVVIIALFRQPVECLIGQIMGWTLWADSIRHCGSKQFN